MLFKAAKLITNLFIILIVFSKYLSIYLSLKIKGGARSSVEECLLREEEATGSNPVESIGR